MLTARLAAGHDATVYGMPALRTLKWFGQCTLQFNSEFLAIKTLYKKTRIDNAHCIISQGFLIFLLKAKWQQHCVECLKVNPVDARCKLLYYSSYIPFQKLSLSGCSTEGWSSCSRSEPFLWIHVNRWEGSIRGRILSSESRAVWYINVRWLKHTGANGEWSESFVETFLMAIVFVL